MTSVTPARDETRFAFTKTRIQAIPTPEAGKRVTYYDTKTPGLQLRVSATGIKTFSVYRRLKAGEPERVTLGRFPAMTVEQAQKQAAEVIAEIEGGANPAEAKRALREEPTLAEFFNEYGDRHGSKKLSWRDDQQRFRDYLLPALGKRKLSSIDRAMIARVLSDAEKAGKSTGTVRQIRALSSNMLSKAVEWGYLDANPAQSVKVSGSTVKRDRFLQPDELARFFEAVVAEPNDIIRDLILLALLTGARRSNVCAMHWREIDLKASVWKIKRTKNGEPQTITLCPEAVAILEMRQADTGNGFVFPGTGKTGHIAEPRKGFARVMERAGIPHGRDVENGMVLHDLRRTLGSWQARTGASLAIIGKSLNHKSQQATAIYARLDLDPVRQSVNTATAAMFEAAGLKEGAEVVSIKRGA
jgi:integrase